MTIEIKHRYTGSALYTSETATTLRLAVEDAARNGANLQDANLLSIGNRSDGHTFYAQIKNDEIWIIAGYRYFSIKDAANHWKGTRGGTQLGDESLQLLKNARALVKIRGLLK